jgi:hypothetical protein
VFDDYHDAEFSPEVKGAVDSIVKDIEQYHLPFEILGAPVNFGGVYPASITNLNEFLIRRK